MTDTPKTPFHTMGMRNEPPRCQKRSFLIKRENKTIPQICNALKTTAAASCLLALGMQNPAVASHAYAYLREQIRLVRDYFGVRITHNIYTDTMDDGSEEYLTINLNRNQSYVIAGLCDESCNDLDLKLYNTSGYLVQSDTALDKYAVVSVTPRVSGQYTLKIQMSDCSLYSCDYAIGVFSR